MVPRTRFGAFARGAKVVLYTKKSGAHLRIIDGGSGYLCEMEPVAHFGLGESGPMGMVADSAMCLSMCGEIELLYGITVNADSESMLRRKEWGEGCPSPAGAPTPGPLWI